MYLVDQNDKIIATAKYEFSSLPQQNSWRNLKYAKVNQNKKYFATYWRYSDNILFWKNKKKINRMRTKVGIDSLVLEDSLMALLLGDNLYIYYNKNRLITKTQKIKFIKQTKFTIHKQIIFKNSETVEIYDFIRKSLTICDNSNINNLYEYCPINDIILIPSGDEFTSFISVWSVKENRIIQEVYTGWLKQFRIKMAKSGKYFIVWTQGHYGHASLCIYSYGDQITCIRKIKNIKPFSQIEWILEDNYLLIHTYIQYQILQIEDGQILDCKLQKMYGCQTNKYIQDFDTKKKQIFILITANNSNPLAHYFSMYL